MSPILWMSESLATALRKQLPTDARTVTSAADFLSAPNDSVSFIDTTRLADLDRYAEDLGGEVTPPGQVVAICTGSLQDAVALLPTHPWLSHVVSSAMLDHPIAADHFANVMSAIAGNARPKLLNWVRHTLEGKRVRLTRASKRVERLDKLAEYFESNGFSSRVVHQLRDAAEELLTNAFYDAPYAAGAAARPIPRTHDVTLPGDNACQLLYGHSGDLAVVRVRDPFGALSRSRIVDVLSRCARMDMKVEVDETMGGAGLGLWRIFAVASFVAIHVVNQHHTDVLVGIAKRGKAQRPFAFHFFFSDAAKRRFWSSLGDEPTRVTFTTNDNVVTD